MTSRRSLPPTWLLVAVLAMLSLRVGIPLATVETSGWILLGGLPLAAGVGLNLSADRSLRRAGTTVLPFETSSALVADGVNRISRNPMYLGFVLILLGLAVFLRSLSPLLVVPGFAFAINRRFISVEERMLDAEFGEVWGRYKHTAGRWVTVRLRSTTGLPRSGAQAAAEGRAHSSTTAPGMRENT